MPQIVDQSHLDYLERIGAIVIVKLFKPGYHSTETRRRLAFLLSLGLGDLSQVICAPTDIIDCDSCLGHVSPRCDGEPLNELINAATLTFHEGLQVAACHENGLAHGDLHNHNVLVTPRIGVRELKLIDIDNFAATGMDPPPMIGHPRFLVPEIRPKKSGPSTQADGFALAVMLHNLLLRKGPCDGYDSTPAEFQHSMQLGWWLLDPSRETGKISILTATMCEFSMQS